MFDKIQSNIIKNSIDDYLKKNISIYTSSLSARLTRDISDEDFDSANVSAQDDYLDSVIADIRAGLQDGTDSKFMVALMRPEITGLQEAYLDSKSKSAGIIYAALYMAMTDSDASDVEHISIVQELDRTMGALVEQAILSIDFDSLDEMSKTNGTASMPAVVSEEQKESGISSEKKKGGKAIIAFLLVIAIALGGLNVYQYISISDLNAQIETLTHDKENLKSSLKKAQDKSKDFEKKADSYDAIIKGAQEDSAGYGSSSFHLNTGVLVLDAIGSGKKVTLTTTWNGSGTVSVSNSNSFVAIYDFDENNWYDYTTLTITPKSKGVTIMSFSNTNNSKTFNLIVIVK